MADSESGDATPSVQFEIPDTLLHGVYCNRGVVSVSGFDFVLDLGVAVPGTQTVRVVARALMSPQFAVALHGLLGDTVQRYADEVGQVPEVSQDDEQQRSRIGFTSQAISGDNRGRSDHDAAD